MAEAVLDPRRLDTLAQILEAEVAAERGHGMVALVARHGEILFHQAFGFTDASKTRPMTTDSVFNVLSITKSFVNILTLQLIERGELLFATRVAEVIPEFAGLGRDGITILHLLTHTSGLPTIIAPLPGADVAILEKVIAKICADIFPIAAPGAIVSYAPALAHALLGEVVRRRDAKGRSIRHIIQEDLLDPLDMSDTSLGLRSHLVERHVPLQFARPDKVPAAQAGMIVPEMWVEGTEMTWVAGLSTSTDIFKLTEMLRTGGIAPGGRILSPAMIDLASRNHTGDKPNNLYTMFSHALGWGDLPAYIGLGFFLRGEGFAPNRFGSLASPRTYGHTGAGSTLFWIDPERDLTFICLSAGLLDEAQNFVRYSRLSDAVSAAAV